jgi:Phage major capsid protein E
MRRRAAICAWFRPCISSGCLPLLLSAADAGSCCGAESDARRTGFRRNTIYDLYNEFGVTAVTPINFALSNASTAVRKKCSQLARTMSQTLGGVAFTSVYGLCGDTAAIAAEAGVDDFLCWRRFATVRSRREPCRPNWWPFRCGGGISAHYPDAPDHDR